MPFCLGETTNSYNGKQPPEDVVMIQTSFLPFSKDDTVILLQFNITNASCDLTTASMKSGLMTQRTPTSATAKGSTPKVKAVRRFIDTEYQTLEFKSRITQCQTNNDPVVDKDLAAIHANLEAIQTNWESLSNMAQ